ncbi:unnamed protein product [Paramecium sonneborni]|uniref:Uncharacterized protein n=1 Tax=Paramecium sonneborni TaxID=65129 RepID=A0A8S1M6P9_9CILI|nr:unnamed protein product [Paramecium sonneborni]
MSHFYCSITDYLILNLNQVSSCFENFEIVVDDISLFKGYLNARTTDKLEYILNYSREFSNLQNNYFNKIEIQSQIIFQLLLQAYSLLFKYRVLTNQLKTIGTQFELHKLVDKLNEIEKRSTQESLCILDIFKSEYRVLKNCIIQILQKSNCYKMEDLRQFEQGSQRNIRVINFQQIKFLKLYQGIQYFLFINYSPQAQLQKLIEKFILYYKIDQLINIGQMKINQIMRRMLHSVIFWN